MPSVPDLTPEEIAAVLEARRARAGVEDALPASLTARLDRAPVPVQVVKQKDGSHDGRVLGVVSLITGIPLMGIVEGTSHGNLAGAAIVMAGVVFVNLAHALGRRRHQ